MAEYYVLVREVHVSYRRVEASSPEEAKKVAQEGGGEDSHLEYSHTLDPETWTVEEVK